ISSGEALDGSGSMQEVWGEGQRVGSACDCASAGDTEKVIAASTPNAADNKALSNIGPVPYSGNRVPARMLLLALWLKLAETHDSARLDSRELSVPRRRRGSAPARRACAAWRRHRVPASRR